MWQTKYSSCTSGFLFVPHGSWQFLAAPQAVNVPFKELNLNHSIPQKRLAECFLQRWDNWKSVCSSKEITLRALEFQTSRCVIVTSRWKVQYLLNKFPMKQQRHWYIQHLKCFSWTSFIRTTVVCMKLAIKQSAYRLAQPLLLLSPQAGDT